MFKSIEVPFDDVELEVEVEVEVDEAIPSSSLIFQKLAMIHFQVVFSVWQKLE